MNDAARLHAMFKQATELLDEIAIFLVTNMPGCARGEKTYLELRKLLADLEVQSL